MFAPLVGVASDESVGTAVTRAGRAGLVVYAGIALSIAAILVAAVAIVWVERLRTDVAALAVAAR